MSPLSVEITQQGLLKPASGQTEIREMGKLAPPTCDTRTTQCELEDALRAPVPRTIVPLPESRNKPLGLELCYLAQGASPQCKASLPGFLKRALLLGQLHPGALSVKLYVIKRNYHYSKS